MSKEYLMGDFKYSQDDNEDYHIRSYNRLHNHINHIHAA